MLTASLPIPPLLLNTTGRIHSIETCGTVDGPGIRFVVFTQGCRLRCLYCHNPDSRDLAGGRAVRVSELIDEILPYRAYLDASGGGVTISGGEPLLQPEFVAHLLQACQSLGLHTALDTSGFADLATAQQVLPHTDLVLLDIKSFDPNLYHRLTHVDLEPTLRLATHLSDIHKPTWIRFVLVPGLTDPPENIAGLAQFVATLTNIDRLEILPFHQMGSYKWQQLGYDYQLTDTPPAGDDDVARARTIFQRYGLTVT